MVNKGAPCPICKSDSELQDYIHMGHLCFAWFICPTHGEFHRVYIGKVQKKHVKRPTSSIPKMEKSK